MRSRKVVGVMIALVLMLGFVSSLTAQDFRGSISGTVKDESGGVLPGATVTVTNSATNIANRLVTSERGLYQARYLISGEYSVEASIDGFQPLRKTGIEVRVGDTLTVDFILKLGGMTESVQVVASTPWLDTTSTSIGQVIDRQQIKELPLADGTAYMLTRLTPGVVETSDLHFSRPMDNANLGGFVTNGAKGGNDFTIDGAPNVVSYQQVNYGGERVGFSPPSDSIAEFRVNTNDFDAQQGHTAGANVNLALKSGGSTFHGSASYFNRSDSRSKNSIFSERAGSKLLMRDYDRYTANVSGPIFKDKTFFMVSYEKLDDLTEEPATYTVPTEKMRRGDFSELLASGINIYDPLTGTTNRTAFEGNIIPADRLNPIALKLLSYYPLPNQTGKADQSNNYFSGQPRSYDYEAALMRLDHNFTPDQKVALTGYWNTRTEDRYNWAGTQNGFDVTSGKDNRDNRGITATYTNIITPSLIGDLRASWSRFGEWRNPAQKFDPATLGFSDSTLALFRGYDYLPRFDITGFVTLGSQRSDYSLGRDNPFFNFSAAPTVTWAFGDHTVRGGYDLRIQKWNLKNNGYVAGRYNFTGAYTRASNSAAIQVGQSLAQFLLGIPTSGGNSYIDNNVRGRYTQTYHALFGQDTWSPMSGLTINAGLRVEVDEGLTEDHGRNITGFDLTTTNPLNDAARAAYAKAPIDEVPVDQFRLRGGLTYSGKRMYDRLTVVLPRLNASYQLSNRMVVRGGIGLFSYPYVFDAINQSGYSQQTLLVSTNDSGKTFIADLNNPFPNGISTPTGSSLGLLTYAGRDLVSDAVTMIVNEDRKTPLYTRWQLGVQRDLGAGWMVQLDYVGSRGRNLPVRRDLNGLPAEYVSFKRERDTAQESYLTASVANPFKGLLPGTTMNGSTIQRQQLLLTYPQFGRVAIMQYNGTDSYHSGQLTVAKRFTGGLSVIASYTQSKSLEQVSYRNSFDTKLESRTSPDDRPRRATIGATVPVPVGKGRKWGDKWGSVMQAIFGGWNFSLSYQYQQGNPMASTTSGIYTGWGHLYFDPNCSWKDLHVGSVGTRNSDGKIIGLDVPAWNTACFYFHDAAVQTNGVDDPKKQRADSRIALGTANARYFPTILSNMRMPNLHLIDAGISKNFDLGRQVKLQIRADFINTINYTVYYNPDLNPRSATFGTFTQQRNNPRDIQLGGRLTF
jgi:hypothetical protein